MSNGDKHYKHMVVRVDKGEDSAGWVLCFTGKGEPAVFNDTPPAELLAAQYREKFPHCHYRVISFQVL